MHFLEEVKAKLNRVCALIASKFSSNKNKPITNNKKPNNKNPNNSHISKQKKNKARLAAANLLNLPVKK